MRDELILDGAFVSDGLRLVVFMWLFESLRRLLS